MHLRSKIAKEKPIIYNSEIEKEIDEFTKDYLKQSDTAILLPTYLEVEEDLIFYRQEAKYDENEDPVFDVEIVENAIVMNNDYIKALTGYLKEVLDISEYKHRAFILYKTDYNVMKDVFYKFASDNSLNHIFTKYLIVNMFEFTIAQLQSYLYQMNFLKINQSLDKSEKEYYARYLKELLNATLSKFTFDEYKYLLISLIATFEEEALRDILNIHKDILVYKARYNPDVDSLNLLLDSIENHLFTTSRYNKNMNVIILKNYETKVCITNIKKGSRWFE